MCAPRFVSVLIRTIDGRWWVVEGIDAGNGEVSVGGPSDRYFVNHGREFATRDEAFAYGVDLAQELGFDATRVIES
jgi:hypothetical protein